VLSWTRVPVIIQRAGARPLSGIRTVLVPLDGGPVSLLALGAAIDLAHATGAHITLLRVVEPMPSSMHDTAAGFYFADRMDPSWDTAALAGAKRHLEELMEQLREGGALHRARPSWVTCRRQSLNMPRRSTRTLL
jgi:nucleotide-binding universal stress UspA family protein